MSRASSFPNIKVLKQSVTQAQLLTFPTASLQSKAAENISDLLIEKIQEKTKVLVFLSGGSGIEMYRAILERLAQQISDDQGQYIKLALVDERYGEYGHSDSNEQQLRQKGVLDLADTLGIGFTSILSPQNLSPEKTLEQANQKYTQALADSAYILALLGLGTDGHTAGWLPTANDQRFQELYAASNPLVYYEVNAADSDNPHRQRFTLSISMLPKIDQAIFYVQGAAKKAAIHHLIEHDMPLHQTPASILYRSKSLPIILSDQV